MRSLLSPAVTIAIFFIAQAIIFREAWGSLVQLWLKMDYAYSMGLLALGLACYTAYQERTTIEAATRKPSMLSFTLLFVSAFVLTVAAYLNIQIGTQLMLIPVLFFGVASIAGWNAANQFTIPILYILFAIPVWDYLNPLLQSLTTLVSTTLVEALGIPALIQGNIVILPYGALEIANGCSGLRYLIVTLILALYFSKQRPNTTRTVVLMFLIAGIFSLVANWIRVTLLIVIAHQSNMESSLVADHEMFGWVVYAVTMIPCLWVLLRLERSTLQKKSEHGHKLDEPGSDSVRKNNATFRYTIYAVIAISVAPMLMGAIKVMQAQSYSETNFETELAIPPSGWAITPIETSLFETGYVGAEQESNFKLVNTYSGTTLNINVLRYGTESQGAELVNNSNQLSTSLWNRTSSIKNNFYGENIFTNDLQKKLAIVWYYRIAETRTTNELKAKFAQLSSAFSAAPPKALVTVSAQCRSNCDQELKLIGKLLESYLPY